MASTRYPEKKVTRSLGARSKGGIILHSQQRWYDFNQPWTVKRNDLQPNKLYTIKTWWTKDLKIAQPSMIPDWMQYRRKKRNCWNLPREFGPGSYKPWEMIPVQGRLHYQWMASKPDGWPHKTPKSLWQCEALEPWCTAIEPKEHSHSTYPPTSNAPSSPVN
jgi:hypothetical protein